MATEFCLFMAAWVTGVYGGTGFFIWMGGNPSIKKMSDKTFAEYWQHTDHFMAARMKIFGPLMLLCVLAAVLALLPQYKTPSFWCMLLAFGILVTDIAFTLTTNHPLNKKVQSWNVQNLPADVQATKHQIAKAFDTRKVLMIASFVLVLLAVLLHRTT